jgi:hypothetical protein
VRVSAAGKHGIVLVTRSTQIVEQAAASRQVFVRRLAGARHRSCARGSTLDAARATALRRAYTTALRVARQQAYAAASRQLREEAKALDPSELSAAKRVARARAQAAAAPARARLTQQALAQARAQAGAGAQL